MSELPEGVAPAQPPEPRESALGVLLRRGADGGWQVLLGVRSRTSRFMPGHHAFPGGRVDREDRPAEPGAHLRCVVRELAEEAGLAIPAAAWLEVGERVTPPMFPVRFRTLFFLAALPDEPRQPVPASAENERFEVIAPAAALEAWRAQRTRIPPPVLPILRALAQRPVGPLDAVADALRRTNTEEQRAPRIEFVPGVWMLPVRTATLPPASHTNVWIPGGRRFVLVDPGATDADEIERLMRVVARRREHGGAAAAVLLTHDHRDHAAGAPEVARRLDVPLRAHRGVLERLDPATAHGATRVRLEPLADGDVLDLDGETLEVHASPGHAPGHLAFHLPRLRALIAGDMVSGLSTILIDPVRGDMGEYLESLERLAALDCTTLLPGHGPPLPAGELRRVIAHRREREAAVVAALRERAPVTLDEIARQAYADTPGLPPPLIRGQTLAHLRLLERRGRARRAGREGASWIAGAAERG